jgi:hypothetical protein
MAKDSKSDIDPRFDPAFQRGFDPSIPIESSAPPRQPRRSAQAPVQLVSAAPPAPAAAPPAPAAPSPAPAVASPTVAAEPKAKPVAPAESVVSEPEDDDETAVVVVAVEDAPEASSVRNPFLLFLGIIAVALIAVGVWLFVRSGEAFNTTQVRSQGDYMTLTATIDMAPFIALLGAATAIGVLFVFAARWRRRR